MKVRIKKNVGKYGVRYYVQYSHLGLLWKDFDWSGSLEEAKDYARHLIKGAEWYATTLKDIDQIKELDREKNEND